MNRLSFLRPLAINGKIRIGPNYDGGYVVYNRILDKVETLVTYGVGWDTNFEEAFRQKTGKMVYMFDPTMYQNEEWIDIKGLSIYIYRLQWLNAAKYFFWMRHWKAKLKQLKAKGIHFINEGISAKASQKLNTLGRHLEIYNLKNKQVLLKMDIEGGEYDVFLDDSTYTHLENVDQLLIEWHDLNSRLHDLERILTRLNADFEIVHIHCNNQGGTFIMEDFPCVGAKSITMPKVLETTLVRRSRIDPSDYRSDVEHYPVPDLDYPNNPRKKELSVEFLT